MSNDHLDLCLPVRKHPRLKGYDYATPNAYFVTICTKNKACLFGAPGALNVFGKVAMQGLAEISKHFPSVQVEKSVVMPNHIHAILFLQDATVSLTTVLGLYKSYVTKQIHQIDSAISVWQTSFHDHVIRNQAAYEKIWLYIDSNPLLWQKDCFYPE